MITIEEYENPDSNWNNRLHEVETGNMYQTKNYGTYLENRTNSKPIYLQFINENGKIIGQNLIFKSIKGKSKLKNLFGEKFISKSFPLISSIMPKKIFWNYGPIIFDHSYLNEISKLFAKWLNDSSSYFSGTTHPLDAKFNFIDEKNISQEKSATFIINLKLDLENIFKNTNKKSVQKNVKRSEERGVKIAFMKTAKDYVKYFDLQKKFRQESDLIEYSVDDIIEGFKLLGPVGWKGLFALLDNEPIGAISFSHFNNYIHESGIARSTIDYEKHLYSQDLLRWKIIEWGVKNNCSFYDLSGVKSQNRSPKEEGIFRNKKKWGGTYVEFQKFHN